MRTIIILVVASFCVRCVPVPTAPDPSTTPLVSGGFFVVCEGLWRQDNATLSFITPTGSAERDVVSTRNVGLRLGDTGSDILVRGDSIYVCASTSGTIEVYHRLTGIWKGRIRFENGREPYRLVIVKDHVAVCSIRNDDCIAEIDLRLLTVRVPRAPAGPAPEGLCCLRGRIYVANSGLGDLRLKETGAGTVSVLDAKDLRVVKTIEGLPNAMQCTADAVRGLIWFTYRHLATKPDSLGGVVCYDPALDSIIDHQRFVSPKGLVVDPTTGIIYVLHRDGIDSFDRNTQTRRTIATHKSTNGNDVWYSLGWWKSQRALLVGTARTYGTDGEVIALDLNGTVSFKAGVGLNPSAFAD